MEPDRILLVVERTDHFEVHFDRRVEFWGLDDVKFGESQVEPIDAVRELENG